VNHENAGPETDGPNRLSLTRYFCRTSVSQHVSKLIIVLRTFEKSGI